MIGMLFKAALRMLVLSLLVYGAFFVRLGERTFYDHASRVASTPEAQELGSELKGVLASLLDKAQVSTE